MAQLCYGLVFWYHTRDMARTGARFKVHARFIPLLLGGHSKIGIGVDDEKGTRKTHISE